VLWRQSQEEALDEFMNEVRVSQADDAGERLADTPEIDEHLFEAPAALASADDDVTTTGDGPPTDRILPRDASRRPALTSRQEGVARGAGRERRF
jgi:hypothetical protein